MKFLNALNKINGVGAQKTRLLLDFFGSAENIWKAPAGDLRKSGIPEKLAEKIIFERDKINPEEEWEKLEKENIKIISFTDAIYPKLLKEIPNPPHIIYVKGADSYFDWNNFPMLAIVGSRKFTQYGKQVAENIARDLARTGIIIVSGMAIGIDAFAHRGALDAGGKTIAVLGSGLEDNMIGPKVNYNLSREIMENGALISDYPLGTSATEGTFPARNRLMAGMTLGTLVIEAAENSGSLITAGLALEFNREVFAVPGPIFSPQSEGTNKLIQAGAKLAASAKDILEELKIEERKTAEEVKKIIPASKDEEKILKILSHEPTHIDNIIKLAKLETNVASSTLSIMEMKGIVKNIGGQNYILL